MKNSSASLLVLALMYCMAVAAAPTSSVLCIGCHGQDGNSTASQYPILAGQGRNYLAKQLRDFKSGKRKEEHMTSMVEAISKDDIPKLAAWFSQQKRNSTGKPANAKGQQIFQQGITAKNIAACVDCHGEKAGGNDAIGFPALAGQHAEYVIAQLKAFRLKQRSNDNGMMQTVAEQLSDAEIKSVAAYIESMK